MCDCFHLAFPNWHAASSGTGVKQTAAAGAGRRLRGPEPGTEDNSVGDEPPQFTEGERPRPQGSSPVEEYPETEKYSDSDKEREAEHDPHHKSGSGKKTKKSGLGSMFEKRSTPKMSKLKEVHSPESGVIVKTAKDGCAEGLIYGGGGKEGIFIKEVVPESPASKSLKLKEGDQVLSATVYFDNMSYEDAIQIMEHAQAYKVKLCLKRKPDITETEPTIESDVIPEEDVYAPELREQGKTKRRGDARISWPKFPSFGKGKKSRFRRSHSSSEADEQRKLELSPTTSDTESPIKSQDAVKGKKKHKMKLSALTKRGRISSSEDQDMDAPTSGQISGNILQTHEASDMLSPECLESPSGERPEVYVTESLKVVEDFRLEQNDQKLTEPQTVQHKVELITIGSTLKTEDLTVALASQESPSGLKSPDGKKKKKEKSELKMKILGKDKSHKKEAKAKSSPKRLKTLGASIDIADQPENEKSAVIPSFESHTQQMEMSAPKVELDIPDVPLVQKSPQKGEEKTKKFKDKQKQDTKTGQTFKLPKVGFSDIATEETIHKINVNVEESTVKLEQLSTEGTEVKEDPYERLSKGRAKLPKREDIEIPGMEDMSMKTKAKGIKEPKAVFPGHYEDIQAETVQLSIDVDSVKEAVSKLPGFKLPKIDDSGVPIPEEITVIDANAQRISVKTPTKVVDTKAKHETHFTKFDISASPEISKTTVKLPKITPADLTSEELLIETKVDLKTPEKKHKTKAKQSDKEIRTEVYKREHIVIPGKESIQEEVILQTQIPGTEESRLASFGIAKPNIKIPNIGFDVPKENISEKKRDDVKGERTIFIQEVKTSKTETRKGKGRIGDFHHEVISDVKIPEIEGIEYIDSVDDSSAKKDGNIRFTGFGINLDATKPNADTSFPEIRSEVKDAEAEDHTIKPLKYGEITPDISVHVPASDMDININRAEIKTLEREGKGSKFKIPNLGISMPKVKGPKIDLGLSKKDVDVTIPEAKAEVKLPEVPEVDVDVSIPQQKMEVEKPELEIKPLQTEGELDGKGGKFKMPKFGIKMPKIKGPEFDLSLSKKDGDVTLPDVRAEGKLREVPDIDVTLGKVDVSIPEQKMEVKKPELEIKPLQTEGELDGQGREFKMPKFGIKMPKIKGPEFDLSLSKKDGDVTLPDVKAEGKLPEVPEIDVTLGKVDVSIPEQKMEVKKPEMEIKPLQTDGELHGQGSKFKMPKFGITMPKVTGPEIDLSLSKKDVDVTLPEAKAEVKVPEVELKKPSAEVEMKAPEIKVATKDKDGSPSKFKMPTFKLPKFGVGMPSATVEGPDMYKDGKIDGADIKIPEEVLTVEIAAPSIDTEGPSIDMKTTGTEHEGRGGKFKMPKFGITMPKVTGPEIDFSLSKKDVDVTLPEAKAEVELPDVELQEPSAKVEIKAPEIKGAKKDAGESPSKFKMPTFKLPKFGGASPNVNVEISNKTKAVEIPETQLKPPQEGVTVDITAPSVDIEGPSLDVKTTAAELDGKGSKFKMPKFGISLPKVQGPKIDLSLSKKDVDVTLPEATAEVGLPEAPKVEVSLGKADVSLPEEKLEVKKPELEMQSEVEFDGKGDKFKVPQWGISMPKVKGPEIHFGLSKKDGDVTLPEAKAEIKVPEVELKEPSAKVEIKAPEVKVVAKGTDGSPSKFKMPTFKLPKFGLGTPNVSVEVPDVDKDVKIHGADINIPEDITAPSIDIEGPSIEMKTTGTEHEGKGSKLKMPHLGFSMPKVKGPKIDLSLSKKDVDVTLPEANADVKLPEVDLGKVDVSIPEAKMEVPEPKAEVKLPEVPKIAVEMKQPEYEVEMDGHDGKFKMPKFGIKMPKVKGPAFDLSLSKKDADVKTPEVDLGKVSIPETKLEVKKPQLEMQTLQTEGEFEGHGEHFKMPKFGIKMPTVKGPEIDLSSSKKNVDVTLPQTKAEVKLPDAPKIDVRLGKTEVLIPGTKAEVQKPELEIERLQTEFEGQGSKFKMPKFGMSMPKVKGPEIDLSFSKKNVDVTIPEAKAEVELPEAPKIAMDIKPPECEAEIDGQGGKFKMPKFGITMPKVKGPEIDFSLSKKDVDVTLPEAKAEVRLPDVELKDPSAKVDIKPPATEAQLGHGERSPSKFKLPTFELPKFGAATPNVSAEVPDMDIKVEGTGLKIPKDGATVDVAAQNIGIQGPSLDVNITGTEGKGTESKFKMPKFGISLPKVHGPEIDVSLSKKDVDVKLPEAKAKLPEAPKVDVSLGKADVSMPEAKIEVGKPQLEMKSLQSEGELDGQGSKYKMPKFGMSMPKVKGPEIDISLSKKDVDITLPEVKAEVKVPDVEQKEPSAKVEIEAPEVEAQLSSVKGSPSKFKIPTFKFPKFGTASANVSAEVPDIDKEIKIDGADMHISVPHTDVDVPNVKAEVQLPEVKVKEPSGVEVDAKLKKPRFSLPRFSFSKPSVKAPEVDVSLPDVKVAMPEGKVEVKGGEVDMKPPEGEAKVDGQGSKFKMPKFGITMPKVTGPEIDLSLSKKDVDVTLPGAKAEVKVPEVELKKPSAEVEIKAPEIKVTTKDKDGSPSKMPTFKLPKFGVGMPSATVEVSDMHKDGKVDRADVKIPEEVLTVEIAAPSIDTEGPSIDMKTTGIEHEGKGGKFKMPKFGMSMPKVKGPEIDLSLSKKNVDVTIPEAKAEIELPEAPKIAMDIKPTECEAEIDGQGNKFKMPKFGITMPKVKGPEIDFSLSKKDVDVTLPEAKAEVRLPDVELKDPSAKVDIKSPAIEAQLGHGEGSPSKFKLPTFELPKFGAATPNVSAEVPDMDIKGTGLKIPKDGATVDVAAQNIGIQGPSLDVNITGTEGKGTESKFKMPKFGISLPKVHGPEIDVSLSKKDVDVKLPEAKAKLPEAPKVDVSLGKADVSMPEAKIEVGKPQLEMKSLQSEGELDGQGSKYKMPKFGMSMPKVKGPEIDISLSKKDVDITLPEVKAEVKVPDVEQKEPSAKMEIEAPEVEAQLSSVKGSPSKFKIPTFKFPKFGTASANVSAEVPDIDKEIKIDGADMHISVPHTDVDVPNVKAEVQLPEVKVKEPSGVEVDAKLKKPRFSLPRFSFSKPSVKAPEVDVSLPDVKVAMPEGKVEVKEGEVDMKPPEGEAKVDGQGSKFKMPKFGITMPKVTGPEIDLSLSKKDVDVTLPGAKAEVKVPDVELKKPSAEVEIKAPEIKVTTKDKDGSPSKMPTFKLPKFGVGMPSATVEVSDMHKDGKVDRADIKIPEEVLTVEIAAPSIDTEGPSIDMKTTGIEHEGKGGKFKMPKFGMSMPKVKGPEIDLSLSKKNVDVTIPEAKAEVELPEAPKIAMDIKPPECEAEIDGQGNKFKMPKFGITMPKVKGPEIDFSLSKKDVDVTLPEAKAEVRLPDVELKDPSAKVDIKPPAIEAQLGHGEGSPSKFKLPTFELPKFGAATPNVSAEVPDMDIKGTGLKIPKDGATVDVAAQNIGIQGPSLDVNITGTEGKGTESKFKMPKFGISLPKVHGPEIDVSLSKKDVDVKLPEAKAKLPEAPKVDVSLGKADVSMPEAKIEVGKPQLEMKSLQSEGELDGQGSKFKMPKFGMSMPKVKGPEIDLSLSKKDVDITLPEVKAEVKVPEVELKKPSAEVEIKAPEIKVATKDTKGSPSKFKMPTFKLPKFGGGMPSATIEVPDTNKDGKIDGADIKIPEEVLTVEIAAPSIDTEGPSIDMKTTGTEHEGKGGKFKMPKFGITMPKVTGPEIDLSLSKKDVDVTLPEAKAEVKVPDVELKKPSAEVEIKAPEIKAATKDKDGSPSKFKMPTFKLPKFGVGMPSATVEVPDTHKDGKIDGADIKIPEEILTVEIAAPSIDTEGPSIDMKTTGTEHEGKGGKFKMPKFGITMPKVTGPEIDLSLSKKDVDVTLPEAKAEVKVPEVELKKPSAEVEMKAPEIKVTTKDKDGSPSKFKMPTFKLPKFGVGMPSATVEGPDMYKDGKIDGADIKIPEEVLTVEIAAPSIDTEGPSIDMKTAGTEHEGKGGKFKMPKFGITMPKVTGPEIDLSLSKKDVDVTLPEAKAEVKVPEVELKKPSAEVEIKAPGIDVQASNVEGSPSKFKMPTFKLPKFGTATPQVSVEVPDVDKQIKVAGADIKLPETKAEVKLPDVKIKEPVSSVSVSQVSMPEDDAKLKKTRFSLPKFSFSKQSSKESEVDVSLPDVDVSLPERNVEVKQPEVELKPPEGDAELHGQESKFKMPKFGISMPKVKGPEIDVSLSKKDVDVTLPEAKAEVKLLDVKIKQPSAKVEIKAPEIEAQAGNVEGSPSKLKMPTLTLPKFGAATPKVSVEVPDVDKDIKIDGARKVPKEGATVEVTAPSIGTEGLSGDVKAKGSELEGSGSKFKMPKFGISISKVKGPEIDLSLSKKDGDVTLPEAKAEVKLPNVEVKEPEVAISVPDVPKVEVEAKSKGPNWTFPKFSFSRTGGKAPDVNVNLETPKVDVTSPDAKAEVCLPNVEVQGPSGAISVEGPPAGEVDANLKKTKFSLPRFSFTKSSVKEPEISAELPHVDVSLPEGEVIVKQPEIGIKAPELEAEQGSKFKLPKFGIALPKTKGPEEDLNASQKDITLPEVKAEVKLPSPHVEMKTSEIEAKSKDVGGSPSKFKMPTVKMPKIGGATYDVSMEAPDAGKVAGTDGAKLKEDVTVNIKGLSVDIKTDVSKAEIPDSETPKTETDSVGLGSPSKFKLPSFKMPKLSFSRPKPEDEYVPVETESKDDQLEIEVESKGESKSPKMTLTSFGEILKNIDVEFDVPNVEEKEVHKADEPSGKQLEAKEKETNTKQDATKSPERTGWFKFPKFGLSSPSEPAKTPEKDKDKKSPTGETVDEEVSPTCSVQSSDAFADISSAMTSEHVGLSLSSPTKVTVKYSDPHDAAGHGEMHSNIITSTTRTELISVEPNLPEKITILSSGVSSSSEDTLRLESGKIHVITSNIHATPEAQHAKLLTAVQVQSAGDLPLKSGAGEETSWTVEDSQGGKRTVFERHLVRETSSERSESKETIVITKQITRMLDSSEPISGETASSIQRLRDSVHSEKMRFFDGAEK